MRSPVNQHRQPLVRHCLRGPSRVRAGSFAERAARGRHRVEQSPDSEGVPSPTAALGRQQPCPEPSDQSCTHMPPLHRSNALSRCQPPHAPLTVRDQRWPTDATDRPTGLVYARLIDDALNVPTTPRGCLRGVQGIALPSAPSLPPRLVGGCARDPEHSTKAARRRAGPKISASEASSVSLSLPIPSGSKEAAPTVPTLRRACRL